MDLRAAIDSFLEEDQLAVVGVSRSGVKFGNMVYKELREKGVTIYQVNPHADEINGEPCYRSLAEVPESVGGVIITVNPEHTLSVVREANEAGIKKVWIQQGAQSDEAIEYCESSGMTLVTRKCIMMFAEPVSSIHKFHRFFAKLFGTYPALSS